MKIGKIYTTINICSKNEHKGGVMKDKIKVLRKINKNPGINQRTLSAKCKICLLYTSRVKYMNKHAYLIMAHNEFYILEKLILLLDDLRNDIYIHIDSKVKNFNFKYYKKLVKRSNIYFVERKNVRWGHMSQKMCIRDSI